MSAGLAVVACSHGDVYMHSTMQLRQTLRDMLATAIYYCVSLDSEFRLKHLK